jgi:hypothetical protein
VPIITGLKEQCSHATLGLRFVFVSSPKPGKFVGQLRRTGTVRETATMGVEARELNRPLAEAHTSTRT